MAVTRFRPIARPQRLSDEVGAVLESRIGRGELAPGTRLPTEAQLAEQFAVSRAVVREAIARLKANGLVESRQGAGAFVARRPGATVFRMHGGTASAAARIEDVFELRLIVEVAAAERAALRRGDDDLRAIGAALATMDAALAGAGDGAMADDAFHCAIAAASGNPLIGRFVEFVGQEFSVSRQPTWSPAGVGAGLAQASQDEHRALFRAIEAGDPCAARAAAERHLAAVAGRLGVDLPSLGGAFSRQEAGDG